MMLGTRDAFDYFECDECGCLQIGSIPDDLEPYYAERYYTKHQRRHARSLGEVFGLFRISTRLRLRSGPIARLLSGRRYGRFDWFRRTGTTPRDAILDVGCGSGRLLAQLHALGFEALTGIDARLDKAREGHSGPRFERSTPETHEGVYRLVMAHHSFEHMADPVGVFSAFGRLVEPGGYLLLRLPLADSWARRRYGADWVQLDAPRHLHLHTRRGLELLARAAGFRVAHVVDDSGAFQIWGSELYRRGIPLAQAGPGGRAVFGPRKRIAARLRARALSRQGLGDQACFYFQRMPESSEADARRGF